MNGRAAGFWTGFNACLLLINLIDFAIRGGMWRLWLVSVSLLAVCLYSQPKEPS